MHREREKTAVLETGMGMKFGLAIGDKEAVGMMYILGCIFPFKLPSSLKETVRKLIDIPR